MNKYGLKSFVVETLCQCDIDELDSYEQLFIEKLDTYYKGYNATKGGDGKLLFNYQEIVSLYLEGRSILETAQLTQCCVDTVRKVLNLYNIPINKIFLNSNCKPPKAVKQLDIVTKEVKQTFNSIADASRWLVEHKYAKKYSGGVR